MSIFRAKLSTLCQFVHPVVYARPHRAYYAIGKRLLVVKRSTGTAGDSHSTRMRKHPIPYNILSRALREHARILTLARPAVARKKKALYLFLRETLSETVWARAGSAGMGQRAEAEGDAQRGRARARSTQRRETAREAAEAALNGDDQF